MASLMYLLFAATLVAISTDHAVAAEACTSISWGDAAGVAIQEKSAVMTSGIRDWKITVANPPQCATVNGVAAQVCDYDVAPEAHFTDKFHIVVHRKGDLNGIGYVRVTVYCTPFPHSVASESVHESQARVQVVPHFSKQK